ncbi:MAG: class I SAM-dependent methyltransferase [Candidatus Heimdallarchaeota archaeon]|nr:class I SAM-dependent methyltransferase [Candidatus Heimdallarchaeota archaeon]
MKKEEIVREGYNQIAPHFGVFRSQFSNEQELEFLCSLLPENAKILDVGCGTGIPVVRYLVRKGYGVTGVDISGKMLELARKNVPEAEYFRYDMNELDFEDSSFHGITALYSLFHVPKEKHFDVFRNFYRMLKPEGVLFFCVGPEGGDDLSQFLGGIDMFWSNYPPEKTTELVKEAGFNVLFEEVLDRGDELQFWVFAQKE